MATPHLIFSKRNTEEPTPDGFSFSTFQARVTPPHVLLEPRKTAGAVSFKSLPKTTCLGSFLSKPFCQPHRSFQTPQEKNKKKNHQYPRKAFLTKLPFPCLRKIVPIVSSNQRKRNLRGKNDRNLESSLFVTRVFRQQRDPRAP